ncbi:MAG: hypothetical protein JEZ00_15310 [Anaerolineaceae bacterium]|nr:hypothetical protein [Anaerolineaceae bacterium]
MSEYISDNTNNNASDKACDNENAVLIKEIKKKYHNSWVQLRNACNYYLGNDVNFSTPQFKNSSLQFAKRMTKATGMGAAEILNWMKK